MRRSAVLVLVVLAWVLVPVGPATAATTVLFEQGPGTGPGLYADSACQGTSGCIGGTQQSQADDFTLAAASAVEEVTVWGFYFPGGATTPDSFTVRFLTDAGGSPGGLLYQAAGLTPVRESTSRLVAGRPEYRYTITLPVAASLPSGTSYLEVFNATTASTDIWHTTASLDTAGGAYLSPTTPGVVWRPPNCCRGLAFRLVGGPANEPPVADAGPDQTVEATGPTTTVMLDGTGSSDPDGDSLSFKWTGAFTGDDTGPLPHVTFDGLGSFAVNLTVDDRNGGTDSDSVTIVVEDTTPPVLEDVPGAINAPATGVGGAVVTYAPPTATDALGVPSLACIPESGLTFPVGSTTVKCTAEDRSGNSASASFDVVVGVDASSIATLVDEIEAAGLPQELTRDLIGPLNQADRQANDGNRANDVAVCNKLAEFGEHVDRLSSGGLISPDFADLLRAFAGAIAIELGC